MKTPLPVVGLDVRKATRAVCHQPGAQVQHLEVPNAPAGLRELGRRCGARRLYGLEATGTYYLAVAYHLAAAGAEVAVVHPLVVRRFLQRPLGKGKRDRKDAPWLRRLGQQPAPARGQPQEYTLGECRPCQQAAERLLGPQTMVSNALKALLHQPLEAERLTRVEERYAAEWPLLCSLPGSGRKTAARLLLFAGGFARLDNHRHLIAKAGLCPHAYPCGTSVRGQTRLTKLGGGLMRSKRYLCRWSACRANHACKALYEGLVSKGQHQKVARSAVCHKLLRQAFAIVKSGRPYHADFAQKFDPMT